MSQEQASLRAFTVLGRTVGASLLCLPLLCHCLDFDCSCLLGSSSGTFMFSLSFPSLLSFCVTSWVFITGLAIIKAFSAYKSFVDMSPVELFQICSHLISFHKAKRYAVKPWLCCREHFGFGWSMSCPRSKANGWDQTPQLLFCGSAQPLEPVGSSSAKMAALSSVLIDPSVARCNPKELLAFVFPDNPFRISAYVTYPFPSFSFFLK